VATTTHRMLLTPVEAAEQLAVSRTMVYELMAAGKLRSITIGRLRRVPVDAIQEFIAGADFT
jgi:excisionase family DNA binding protein